MPATTMIRGGAGNDVIYGGSRGRRSCTAEAGNDSIYIRCRRYRLTVARASDTVNVIQDAAGITLNLGAASIERVGRRHWQRIP